MATILARPLLDPDRRSPSNSSATAGGGGAPEGLPRLAAVLVGPFGRSAIFVAEGHKPVVVSEGARLDAWTIRSIEAGTVQVSGPGGERTLHPSFQSSPAAEAAPVQPPAGPLPPGRPRGLPRTR